MAKLVNSVRTAEGIERLAVARLVLEREPTSIGDCADSGYLLQYDRFSASKLREEGAL